MSNPPAPAPTAAVMETVEDIMRLYRSLPPLPSVEDVEAATAVIRTADADLERKLAELEAKKGAAGVPEELLYVWREVRRNLLELQCREQKWEAVRVVEMDRRGRVFDELIQRASRLLEGGGGEKEAEKRREILGDFEIKKSPEEKLGRSSSLKLTGAAVVSPFPVPGNVDSDKLSLIKVAGVIEKAAKSGTLVLNLEGKLKDEIEWLPVSLGKLTDVTELNLSENRIMALPTSIGSLRCLAKLHIHSNQLINLPDTFGELTSLIDLDLHCNRLRSLPASFGNLSRLTNLDLSSNQLTVLPETLGNLICLKTLNAETNGLEEVPYTIGSCTSLVELRLDFNELRALPEAIGKLENLEVLTAHYNRIGRLPTTMASLTKLKELDVSFNEVDSVPESLCLVTSLVKLNVGNNFADLRSLPRSIGNLEMLEELNISNNQIRLLPDSFRMLSKLRVLHTDETPLEVPPREVCKLGAQAVVRYMADLLEPKEPTPEVTQHKGFFGWLCSSMWPCGKQTEDPDSGRT